MPLTGFAFVILALALLLAGAKLFGHLAIRLGQPAVLGELIFGVLLGQAGLLGLSGVDAITHNPSLGTLAQLGALVLLFQVGLESTVREMICVAPVAGLVALVGVVTPFALGWGVGAWLLPSQSPYAHAFLGATLTATSVGITARVLADIGKSRTPEARVILGAAVIDDILGLLILAIVSGAIVAAAHRGTAAPAYGTVGWLLLKSLLFLGGALGLGVLVSPRLFRLASRLQGQGVLLATALVICLALSFTAGAIGLAPIVGAYAAGLILEEVHWRDFAARGERRMEELLQPVATLLVPVFFVLMGMRVDLGALAHPRVLALAAALTGAAILGKQACGLAVRGRGLDALSIGIGMIPRGEVGLIFAAIGTTLSVGGEPVIHAQVYSAVVFMVIVTTMVTPPALKWSMFRHAGGKSRRLPGTPGVTGFPDP